MPRRSFEVPNNIGTPWIGGTFFVGSGSPGTLFTAGQNIVPDMGKLQPKTNTPYVIDEVGFNILHNTDSLDSIAVSGGYNFRAGFRVGNFALTNTLLPIISMCSPEQGLHELYGGLLSSSRAFLKIKFSKPLLMRPGEVLTPEIQVVAENSPSAYLDMAYRGRILPEDFVMPSRRWVPFFSGTDFKFISGRLQRWTTDSMLANPWINKQYFVESMLMRNFKTNGPAFEQLPATTGDGPNLTMTFVGRDGYERPVIPKPTPMYAAIDADSRKLRINDVLEPGELFRAHIVYDPTEAADYVPTLALVGYREEAL